MRLEVRSQIRRNAVKASDEDARGQRRDEEARARPRARRRTVDRDRGERAQHERVRAVAGEVLAHGRCRGRRARRARSRARAARARRRRRGAAARSRCRRSRSARTISTSGNGLPGRLRALGAAPRPARRPRRDLRRGGLAATLALVVPAHWQPAETLTRQRAPNRRETTVERAAGSASVHNAVMLYRAYLLAPYPRGVPRNDPTDTGGLFIGRRPGTGPLHFRGSPERGGGGRRRADGVLAAVAAGGRDAALPLGLGPAAAGVAVDRLAGRLPRRLAHARDRSSRSSASWRRCS